MIIEYLSAPSGNVRSWCLIGPEGKLVDGWFDVHAEDTTRIFAA
jgi:hypothetical protein